MEKIDEFIPKDAIGETLLNIMKVNKKIVVLSSDVSESVNIEQIKQKFPNRFFEMGIAEQSTMTVAGGLASEGFIPVYAALAIFSAGMTYPQMRQVCNANLNVKIIGTHPGVDNGGDGSGHHATEDLAITRAIPRMTVLTPSDINEVSAAVKEAIKIEGPVYIRAARAEMANIHHENCEFLIGKVEVIEEYGDDFAIVYEGSAAKQALEAWSQIRNKKYKGKLVSIRTIKPIDKEYMINLAKSVNLIITIENHSIIGGLYSAICETLGGQSSMTKIIPIGFKDCFTESGDQKDIKDKYGLNAENICKKIIENMGIINE